MWIGSSYEVVQYTIFYWYFILLEKQDKYFRIQLENLSQKDEKQRKPFNSWIIQRSMDHVSSLTTFYPATPSLWEGLQRRVCQLTLLQRMVWGETNEKRSRGASAVQRTTWDIYSSVTTQRVNIKYSSSKSWRMVHSESFHFPILPLLHNTNAQRPKSFFASLNLCNSSLENWDI